MSKKVGFGRWFLTKKRELEDRLGHEVSVTEFARYLGVSQASTSFWLSEDRKPSGEAALEVCKRLGDYSLLDILGYSKPEMPASNYRFLPSDFRDRLESAMHEIYIQLADSDLLDSLESDAARSIAISTMARFGFSFENSKETE